jgi:hypothetical protein
MIYDTAVFTAQFILIIIIFLASVVTMYILIHEFRLEIFLLLFAVILSFGYMTGYLDSWAWKVIILTTSIAVFMLIKKVGN